MNEFAFTLNLKDDPEAIALYRYHHDHFWPEVEAALKKVGILDLKIFLLGRRLFMYITAKDDFKPETDFPRYLKLHEKCQEWEELMGTFQEKVPEAGENEKWAKMEKIFEL